MGQLSRWTVCLVANHRYHRIQYGKGDDSGYFLRCRRCGHENHNDSSIRPTMPG